jgi:hypothetical protein
MNMNTDPKPHKCPWCRRSRIVPTFSYPTGTPCWNCLDCFYVFNRVDIDWDSPTELN